MAKQESEHNLQIDPEVDAAYLRVREGEVVRGDDLSDEVRVDYDAEGNVLGIELVGLGIGPDLLSSKGSKRFALGKKYQQTEGENYTGVFKGQGYITGDFECGVISKASNPRKVTYENSLYLDNLFPEERDWQH